MTKISMIFLGKVAGARLGRYLSRARDRRELRESSDRALADMGLERSDIDAVVDGTYRRA